LLTVPLVMYGLFVVMIRREETYLRERFGAAYEAYAARVNRVLPDLRRVYRAHFYPVPTGAITEQVTALTTGDATLFLYAGGDDLVAIDSGYGGERLRRALGQVDADPARVTHLFLTHADHDHVGGIPLFPNAQVYLPRDEVPLVAHARARLCGVYYTPALDCDYATLVDGERVTVGAITVEAIATPGHTCGSMSYLVNGHALFTGDTIALRNGRAHPFYRIINMDTPRLRRSIARLARLEGVDLLCTAHTGYTRDVAGAMEAWCAAAPIEA